MLTSQKIIIFVVSLALFMEALDSTILNTAIPAMSHSLNVNPINLKIALISYLLSLAVFIPISGWMADKYGAKKIFIVALGVFTASSLWCGFAHNLLDLVVARAVQGIGGALCLPCGRLILFRLFPRHEIVNIMSRVIMLAAVAMMLGPLLGGVITHNFSWPWIFWVNVPVGIFAIAMASWLMPAMPAQTVPPLDKLGFLLFGCSLAGYTFSLSASSESSLHVAWVLAVALAATLLMMLYIWHSYKHPHPIVKTELFTFRTFQVSTISNLISRVGFGGIPFLLPILLQVALGYTAEQAGFLLAPIAVGIFLVKPFASKFLNSFGYRKLLIINTAMVALSLWSFIFINNNTPSYVIALLTFMFGFTMSLQYSCMNSLAYAEISTQQLSAATSIMGTLQQLAQSFGVAIGALLIHYFSAGADTSFLLTVPVFHNTFFVMGIITMFSTLIFMYLRPEDGQQMIEGKT